MGFMGLQERPVAPPDIWKHTKTGGLYQVLAYGYEEKDLTRVVIYRKVSIEDLTVWVRPAAEFHDGRFVRTQ